MPLDQTARNLVAIRDRYVLLREAQRTLNKRLQTMLPRQAFKECAQKLGFWQHGQLVFDVEDHVDAFTDYVIYDYRLRGGTNAVERLWKLGEIVPGTSAHEVLEAMQEARFTVVRVVKVLPGTGAVVDDLFYGERETLADIMLSENSEPGLTMAARLLTFPDFVMTTGAGFRVGPRGVEAILANFNEGFEGGLPMALRESFDVRTRSQLAANMIRAALAPRED